MSASSVLVFMTKKKNGFKSVFQNGVKLVLMVTTCQLLFVKKKRKIYIVYLALRLYLRCSHRDMLRKCVKA